MIFLPILAKTWLSWKRLLDPCNPYGSVTDDFPDGIAYHKTKPCMDMLHTTEVMAIFGIFWLILAKIWLPWQRPVERCNKKCLLWIV